VFASEAIRIFNGQNFCGNKISVKKEEDFVINLSQKRSRSPEKEVLTLLPTSKTISLTNHKPHQETQQSGNIYLGGSSGNKPVSGQILLNNSMTKTSQISSQVVKEHKPEIKEESVKAPVKVAKIESLVIKDEVKAVEEAKGKKEEVKGKIEEVKGKIDETKGKIDETKGKIDETKGKIDETKGKKDEVKGKKDEVKEEKGKVEVKEKEKNEVKEDNIMIEVEGSKFLKTADENKLHCIACDKEITKKSLKAHVASKAHKSFIQ
jgi:hypothetical protein